MEQRNKGFPFTKAASIALSILIIVSLFQLSALEAKSAYAGVGTNSVSDRSWNEVKGSIESYMGAPYAWGGKSPSGWDCSGFVGYIAEHVYGVPGGGDYYTGSMVAQWSKYTVFSGSSATDYNAAFDAGVIKPGDIILFFDSSGIDVHCAIAGEGLTVYHAWFEGFGTGNCRFDYMWGIDGGHGKTYASFAVYRGLAQSGWMELQKGSAIPSLSDGNTCYSLEGAVYGIYNDAACGSQVSSLTTDGAGYAKSGDLNPGTYYVKEQAPPKGYALDKSVYSVAVSSGSTAKVNGGMIYDMPQSDPSQMWVGKIDRETTLNMPQGSASLENAQFTIKYYAGYYDTKDIGWTKTTTPMRTWVVRTDAEGRSRLDTKYLVSGDPFYFYGTNVTIPLGTVTIQETKAPEGYLLGNPVTYVQQVSSEGSHLETVEVYNAPEVSEQIARGDHRITKSVPTNNDPEKQDLSRILVEGIQFQYINDNEGAVISPSGESVPKGGVVITTTTDANGDATTRSFIYPKISAAPLYYNAALPYGTYIVHEVIPQAVQDRYKAEHGITLIPVDDWKITIDSQGQYDPPQLVTNKIPQTPLKIVKKDKATGNTILLDCSFQIFDSAGNLITYTDHYSGNVVDTWKTGNDGELTLPMKLDEGTYRVKEVKAPDGYVLSSDEVTFTVDEYRTWDNPITIEFFDTPIMAELEILKTDGYDGGAVVGAEYTLRAATEIITGDGTVYFNQGDIVASGLKTDVNGRAKVPNLFLGKYTLFETKAPKGYALDTREHAIEIIGMGQDIPVVAVRKDVVNEPTTLRLVKTDQFTGEVIEGAKYRIWQDGADGEETYDTPGAMAKISAAIQERDSEIASVTANDPTETASKLVSAKEGDTVEFFITCGLASGGFRSCLASVSFDKGHTLSVVLDGEKLARIDPLIVKGEGLFDFTGTTDGAGTIILPYLLPGKYSVVEIEAPEGYLLPDDLVPATFEVDDQGLIGGKSFIEVKQTNRRVDIKTYALDKESGSKNVINRETAAILDTVSYTNLLVDQGKEYTVKGVLMNQSTGEPLLAGGKEVRAEKTFVPDTADGTVEIEFTFDASALAGTSATVFEELYEDDVKVATHTEIDSQDQTVGIVEVSIYTLATDKETGAKTAVCKDDFTMVDTVSYSNLIVGKEYTLKGVLMDKGTGKELLVDGRGVYSEASFVPTEPNGTCNVEFAFDASSLAGKEVVVFEKLLDGDKVEAVHEDINDRGQTVAFSAPERNEPPEGETYDKTGNPFDWRVLAAFAAISALGVGSGFYAYRQRKLGRSEDETGTEFPSE